MIKKSVKIEIDTKEASLTKKEASLQSPNVELVGYCEHCKKDVKLKEKMSCFLCSICRRIIKYR